MGMVVVVQLTTKKCRVTFSWVLLVLALAPALHSRLIFAADTGHMVRVKDVAAIEGIRDNQLVGYGLVVGLHGTGDSQQTIFPYQSLVSALERMGITVPQSGAISAANMQVKNMAGVFVVATLPPFTQPGYKLDVTVSSAGDARSLEGGILLMTPLYGPDGKIFAQAQGALVLGGYVAAAGGNTRQVNHPTTARIPDGALVERPVPFDLKQLHMIDVVLNDADFHTAERMATSIDEVLGAERAHALDSRRVEVAPLPGEDLAALLDKIESAPVEVYPRARVVVNERTGTVVIGGNVQLQPVSILHGGLSVNVLSTVEVSQPNALSTGTTQVVQQTAVQAEDKPVNRIDLKAGATVEDLVQELQRTGAGARDVISILQAMKEAGALEADLEVL
ncbi:MAG TPA: flagellar basal body P-ring protein FlgI [Terracidiphilus sp.]|jgi:flagellar P-ring protein FlgI|nr:flagellar basal body P-ring protein FlgI [Terracidiphilus sp.]